MIISTQPLPRSITEAQFSQTFKELAQMLGWKMAHFRPARTAHGYRTAVEADGAGWPDWFLIHKVTGDRFATELKVRYAKPSPEQKAWARLFELAAIEHHFWWPPDWPAMALRLGL